MRVAVVGAGVAGSFLAYLLSARKIDCLIYEGRPPREKPCGGGCTAKITQRYPLFPSASVPRNQIYDLYYESSRHNSVHLHLRDPIWIYSRFELDGHLRDLATRQGARVLPGRVTRFERQSGSWLVHDSNGGTEKYDFLVGADGATSIVRKRLAKPFDPADLSATLGYYVPLPSRSDAIHVRFLDPDLDGYLWSFPRVDHASVGIINSYRALSASELMARLHQYLKDLYGIEDTSNLRGYSAPVPTPRRDTLERQKVGESNWALVGDAAGFADPITAEGIAYAMRSAELLAAALADGRPENYAAGWRDDFGAELLQAAKLKQRFYRGNFAADTFINRMLQLTRDSAAVQEAQNDLIAGRFTYKQMAKRLVIRSPRILYQVCASWCRRKPGAQGT
ncbi:MAG: NAD(P)/FAD-dependent oxidoreductase [Acidobacteria bacterium]|nr:MAG: NAD(P)/FAD-dependent oxidoreductase [Acidobacteriota bacterium]